MLVNTPSDDWQGVTSMSIGNLAIKCLEKDSLVFVGWPGADGERVWHPCRVGQAERGRWQTTYLSLGKHEPTGETGDYDFPPDRYGRDWMHEERVHASLTRPVHPQLTGTRDVQLLVDFSIVAREAAADVSVQLQQLQTRLRSDFERELHDLEGRLDERLTRVSSALQSQVDGPDRKRPRCVYLMMD